MALRWVPDVLCRRAGGHVCAFVPDYYHGDQAVARERVESAEFAGGAGEYCAGWGCVSCCTWIDSLPGSGSGLTE